MLLFYLYASFIKYNVPIILVLTKAQSKENANKLAQIIHSFCESEGLPHLDAGAMAKLTEYASKLGDTVNVITNGLSIPDKLDELLSSEFNNITYKSIWFIKTRV